VAAELTEALTAPLLVEGTNSRSGEHRVAIFPDDANSCERCSLLPIPIVCAKARVEEKGTPEF